MGVVAVNCLSILLFLCCTVVSVDAAGEYRTVEVQGLRITIDSEWPSRTAPGYVPVRFDLTNSGEARVIEIVGQGSRFFRGGRGSRPPGSDIRRAVRLARGDRVRFTIPVPIFADSESIRFEVREDGEALEHFSFTGFQSATAFRDAATLIVADAATDFGRVANSWRRLATPVTGRPGMVTTIVPTGPTSAIGPGGRAFPPLDLVLDPTRLPSTWLGFTGLRAVVIRPDEWQRLNDDQKGALLTWTACGGDLLLVDGRFSALVPSIQDAAPGAAGAVVRAYFFGRIHLLSSAALAGSGLADVLSTTEKLQDSNFGLPANRASDWGRIAARGFRLPIPGVEGVPARAYLLILLVFSGLIGPVNYWMLRRKRQQVLFVVTAPIISAVFILLLGGYVLAGEGFGVRGRVVTFTMLDQVRQQAVTRAIVSMYAAGMAPSGGLRFERDAAIFPLGTDGNGTRERLVLDLTEAQMFAAGLIQARAPTNFDQITFRTARERLSISHESVGVTVVNGLDAPIAALVYREGTRFYTLTAALAAGGKATVKPAPVNAADLVPADLPLSSRFVHLFENQPDRSYLAILERSPFWNRGVGRVDERGSFHLVIGWPGGQP